MRNSKSNGHRKIPAEMNEPAVDALYQRGVTALEERRLDDARHAFKAVLDGRPGHANAMYRMGEIEHLQGHRPEAAWFYMKTLDIDPDHVSARAQLARLNPGESPGGDGEATRGRRATPLHPASDFILPDTEEEFDSFERRLRRKRRIEWWAVWNSVPLPLRALYVVFCAAVLTAFVVIMVLVLAGFPG
jgi:tetratricopeptide (TPR) repeat protein